MYFIVTEFAANDLEVFKTLGPLPLALVLLWMRGENTWDTLLECKLIKEEILICFLLFTHVSQCWGWYLSHSRCSVSIAQINRGIAGALYNLVKIVTSPLQEALRHRHL